MSFRVMTLLIIIFLISNGEAIRYWQQKGYWNQQLYSNKSFLFSFLGVQSGYAKIEGKTQSSILNVQIGDNQRNHSKRIKFTIWMQSKKYATDEIYNIETYIDVSFELRDGQITFGQQENRIKRQLMFNVTLRQNSYSQGQWKGYLRQNQKTSKKQNHLYTLNYGSFQLLIALMFQSVILRFRFIINKPIFGQMLGNWSTFILAYWMINQTYRITNQSYYLQYSLRAYFLTFVSILIFGTLCLELLIYLLLICEIYHDKLTKEQYIFSLLLYILIAALIIPQSYFKLWHCLAVVVIFEIWQMSGTKMRSNFDRTNKILQIICLSALYIFPCAIFPILSFQISYPEYQKQMWWCYISFYLIEVVVFLLKTNGGMQVNFKRLIFKARKWIYKSEYENIQNKLCPLCLEKVQESEMNMNAAGELQSQDWIQASCNHYFHKSCLKEYIEVTDGCFFDQVEWSTQLKDSFKE